jgi:hypothetical protein
MKTPDGGNQSPDRLDERLSTSAYSDVGCALAAQQCAISVLPTAENPKSSRFSSAEGESEKLTFFATAEGEPEKLTHFRHS